MIIFIKIETGKTFALEVQNDDTVGDIFLKMSEIHDHLFHTNYLRIEYAGKIEMRYHELLSYHGISKESTLHLF